MRSIAYGPRRRKPPSFALIRSRDLTPTISEPPIVDAVIVNGFAVITCCHCGRRHHHSPEPGHRVAHCGQHETPNSSVGYILRIVEAVAS